MLEQETTPKGIMTSTDQSWLLLQSSHEPLKMHVEWIFLTPNALYVRTGPETSFPYPDGHPIDPDFPLPALRERLFTRGVKCGLEVPTNDRDILVNPRGSALELKHASPPFGL